MEQLSNKPINNDIQQFMAIFKKKGKLWYRWHKTGIRKMAIQVSPSYRDFVNKILSNTKLKIIYHADGYCLPSSNFSENMSKRMETLIAFDYCGSRTFLHELSHSIDFLFGRPRSLSCNVIVQDGKTLRDIFDEEFKQNHKELREFIMNEYRQNINANIHAGAYDIFINNMPKYLTLCKCEDKKQRKALQDELYKCGFVEVYYQIATKSCFKILDQKYLAILDALSAIYPIDGLFLTGHEKAYYMIEAERPVYEFFANVCADKLMGEQYRYDQLIKLMPKSFNAFERLFVLIYDNIQNNKRFTNLPVVPYEEPEEIDEDEDAKQEEAKA